MIFINVFEIIGGLLQSFDLSTSRSETGCDTPSPPTDGVET